VPYTRAVSTHATLEDWEPHLPGSAWFSWLWLVVALSVAHTLFTLTGLKILNLELTGLIKLLIGPVVVTAMVLLAKRKYQVGRSSIYWMAISIAVWWLADVLHDPVEALFEAPGQTFKLSEADLEALLNSPYLIACLCMLRAVWQLPQVARLRQELPSIWSETLMLLTAALAAMWRFSIANHLLAQQWNSFEIAVDLLVPILSVGLLGFLLLAVMRQGEHVFVAYHWLVLGSLCFAVTSLIHSDGANRLSKQAEEVFGLWGMAFWLTSALTGTQPRVRQHPVLTRFVAATLLALPYVAVLSTYLITLSFVIGAGQDHDATHRIIELVLLVAVGIVTALVIVRQFLMILENRILNETLERRVAERGQQLEVSQARLNASERLASLGQLTAGLAHEVNTPLASAMNSVMQADRLALEYQESIGANGVTDDDHRQIALELRGSLDVVKGTLNRLGELIRKMRAQGRNPNEGAVRFNPIKMTHDALVMLEHPALQAKVELLLETGTDREALFVHGDPVRFAQVVTNLTQNAIHACEDGRKTDGSRVRLHFTHSADHVTLHVSDNGSGIPENVLPRIFDPLFTTKADGRGTGLGLSIIKDIVTSHFSGQIYCETTAGKGTTFTVTMNRVHESMSVVNPSQPLELATP
jgi:signal transduction histidine kinase